MKLAKQFIQDAKVAWTQPDPDIKWSDVKDIKLGKTWMEIRPFRFIIPLENFSPDLDIGETVEYDGSLYELTHMELISDGVSCTAELRRTKPT